MWDKTKISLSKDFLYFVFVIAIIYLTDTMVFSLNNDFIYMRLARGALVLISLILLFIVLIFKRLKITNELLVLMFVILLVISNSIINDDTSPRILFKAILFLFGFLVNRYFNYVKVIKIFVIVMIFIVTISLIVYSSPEAFLKLDFFPTIVTSTRQDIFRNLWITVVPYSNRAQERNWGPFWEPGVYQAYILLAMFFLMFYCEKLGLKDILVLFIFIIGLFTTFSTTGYLALPILVFAYMLNNNIYRRKKFTNIVIILFIFISIAVLITINENIYYDVFLRKFGEEAEGSRFLSVSVGIKVWIDNFLMGVGPQNLSLELSSLAGRHFAFTNTIIAHFTTYGVFVGIYFIYNLLMMINSLNIKYKSKVMLIVAFSIIFSGQNLIYSGMIAFIIFNRQKKS